MSINHSKNLIIVLFCLVFSLGILMLFSFNNVLAKKGDNKVLFKSMEAQKKEYFDSEGIETDQPSAHVFYCGSKIKDDEGNIYSTIKIGSQCWMAQNLRRGVMINNSQSQADANNGNIEKYCYGNNPTNCTNYGALYQWHTVMAMTQHCDWTNEIDCTINIYHRGICPIGWHVPSFSDYETLVHGIDNNQTCNLDCWNGPCDCSTAGGKLKISSNGFPIFWNGTDDYNFSTVPAGATGPGGELQLNEQSYSWMSTPLGADPAGSAYAFNLTEENFAYGAGLNHISGFSVRCLKN